MSERPVLPLLRDPAGLDEDLRRALGAASDHEPSPEALAKLGAKLAAALPPGTLPPTGTPPSLPPAAGGALSGGLKWLVAIGIGGVVAGGAWMWPSEKSASPIAVVSSAPSTSITPPPAIAASPAAPAATVAELLVDAGAPTERANRMAAAPKPTVPEATLLTRAHEQLLGGDAEGALASVTEHARAYPNGTFAQEREVIAIEALSALGRRAEAERRAASFHAAYPQSSHGERVDRLIANVR